MAHHRETSSRGSTPNETMTPCVLYTGMLFRREGFDRLQPIDPPSTSAKDYTDRKPTKLRCQTVAISMINHTT